MSTPVLFFTAGLLAGFFAAFLASRWIVRYAATDGELAFIRGARVNAWKEVAHMIEGQADYHAGAGNEPMRVALQSYLFWVKEREAEARIALTPDE